MTIGHDLYLRLPWYLQNAALSAYGFRLKQLRYGGRHLMYLGEVRERERLTASELERFQRASLHRLIAHAYGTVPHYMARDAHQPSAALEDLGALPFTTKDDLRGSESQFTSTAPAKSKNVTLNTSGTTGSPVRITTEANALQLNYAFFRRVLDWAGAPTPCRTAVFAGRVLFRANETNLYWRRNLAQHTLLLSSYHIGLATAKAYLGALESFSPDLIDSYPSSLSMLARALEELGLTPSVRLAAIITSSESLTAQDRAVIERIFACRVTDYYGAAEMTAMIAQCRLGSYHHFTDYGVLEILVGDRPAKPGEQGELVTTGFVNPRMPLIRYRTGDIGSWSPAPCACGSAFPTLSSIGGRIDDILVLPDGRSIGRLDPILKGVRGIAESQLVQHSPARLTMRYVAMDDFRESDLAPIAHELELRLGSQVTVSFERVRAIPRTAGGKLKAVIREWSP